MFVALFLLSEAQPKNAIVNPPPNLEMTASKLACFKKQINILAKKNDTGY
jgi:hypothetical protein